MSTRYRVFAAVAPGFEADAVDEASERFPDVAPLPGGVRWSCSADDLWWALHHLRIPDNIRVRIARFEARDFRSLERALARVPWHAYLSGPPADVRVVARKSRLNHTDAIAERVRKATADRPSEPQGRIFIRIDKDKVIVSADATGTPLHHRGRNRKVGRAPIRETLAAACVRAAGIHDSTAAVFDPFCGSGTLIFEAAAVRAGAPSVRPFAMTDWPSLKTANFEAFEQVELRGTFGGSDRHAPTLALAAENGELLLPAASWAVSDARDAQPPRGAAILSNLPYGKRLDDARAPIRALVALLHRRSDLEDVFVIDGTGRLEAISGLGWETLRHFDNRGLSVRLLRATR